MDLLLAESGERSAQLVNAIGEKDAELAQLRRDLDGAAEDKLKMEAQIMVIHALETHFESIILFISILGVAFSWRREDPEGRIA